MPRKHAGQRVAAEMDYSGAPVVNPLYQMRMTWNSEATQRDYALHLGTSRSVVGQAEDGMYPLIPAVYRSRIKDIKLINSQYQTFRRVRRALFWDPTDFPKAPAKLNPMVHLLGWFELKDYTFASRMCIPHSDVHKMTHDARRVTEAFREALLDIGLDEKWINEFTSALQRSTTPRLAS